MATVDSIEFDITKDYSQCGEQPIIVNHFKDLPNGSFLEIGAYDGISYSNTWALVNKGWSGVAFEPDEAAFEKLSFSLSKFPITTVKQGVGDHDGLVGFWDGGCNALSTTVDDHMEMWVKAGAKFKKTQIEMICWDTLIDQHGFDFDLISIDIEGNSVELFEMMPVERFVSLKMIVVEYDFKTIKLPGWHSIKRTSLNEILVRDQ